jgi:hypothetical protein
VDQKLPAVAEAALVLDDANCSVGARGHRSALSRRGTGLELIGSAGYEVQGRRADRDAGKGNNVRLASASDLAAAFAVATEMVGDGFTVWVFETDRAGGRKSYRLLETLRPSTGGR